MFKTIFSIGLFASFAYTTNEPIGANPVKDQATIALVFLLGLIAVAKLIIKAIVRANIPSKAKSRVNAKIKAVRDFGRYVKQYPASDDTITLVIVPPVAPKPVVKIQGDTVKQKNRSQVKPQRKAVVEKNGDWYKVR